jgi:hypothetical protein
MYEFTIVVLLGIGTLKLVDALETYVDFSKFRSTLTIALAIALAWALEFSLFEAWGVAVRSDLVAYAGTGLMIAAAGQAVPLVLAWAPEIIGRRREAPVSRAA